MRNSQARTGIAILAATLLSTSVVATGHATTAPKRHTTAAAKAASAKAAAAAKAKALKAAPVVTAMSTPVVATKAMGSFGKSPADIARGKALFTGTCGAYCHRPGGAAAGEAGDAPSLFDCEWRHGGSDAEIFRTVTRGVEGTRMVAFGGAIPDEDIWRIIAYLRSSSQCKSASPG